ncbi:MAG: hypothetical protein M1830_001053 [Pleopsidium flavum]|nr:MAG: hypothetical protein M1830_001053 [Pleopsidium flavum]
MSLEPPSDEVHNILETLTPEDFHPHWHLECAIEPPVPIDPELLAVGSLLLGLEDVHVDPVLKDLKVRRSETFQSLSLWNKDSEDSEDSKDSEDSEVKEVMGRQLSRYRLLQRRRGFWRSFLGVSSLITISPIAPIILIIYYSTCYFLLM